MTDLFRELDAKRVSDAKRRAQRQGSLGVEQSDEIHGADLEV